MLFVIGFAFDLANSQFRYMNYREAVIDGVDDGDRYEALRLSLQKMKFTNEEGTDFVPFCILLFLLFLIVFLNNLFLLLLCL
jgi:hypothetical protein